jgi:hypothetical protein
VVGTVDGAGRRTVDPVGEVDTLAKTWELKALVGELRESADSVEAHMEGLLKALPPDWESDTGVLGYALGRWVEGYVAGIRQTAREIDERVAMQRNGDGG